MPIDTKRLHRMFTTLMERRQPWEPMWREVAKYYMPTSMHWTPNGVGPRTASIRGTHVFDDTPAWAAGRFAAALLGMIMNPSTKWLEFELYTDNENQPVYVQQWLGQLRDTVLYLLQCPEVGFYDAYHEHLLDYAIFGEACMFIDRDPATGFPRFTPYPLEQCYIGMGAGRHPNMVFRRFEMTALNIAEFFTRRGDVIPPIVLRSLEKPERMLDKFTIIHGVFPRDSGIAGGIDVTKPWASVYYLEQQQELIRESGFDLYPFSTPRFMLFASEDHGQGPGTLSLSNVKTLNTIIKTVLTSDQRLAAPSYVAQRRGWIKPLNFTPWHINYFDGFDIDEALRPIGNEGQPQAGKEWIQMYQEQILRAFYLDRLIKPQKAAEVKEMEVLVDEEERLRDLIPQMSRLHAESIAHVITNVTNIAVDMMPPPPPELLESIPKIRYLSPLAKAQRLLEVSNATRTIQQVLIPMAQMDPAVVDAIDPFRFVQWSFDQSGFPAEVRRSEEEFMELQQAKQEQEMAAQGMGMAHGASEIAKNVAQAQAASGMSPLEGLI